MTHARPVSKVPTPLHRSPRDGDRLALPRPEGDETDAPTIGFADLSLPETTGVAFVVDLGRVRAIYWRSGVTQ